MSQDTEIEMSDLSQEISSGGHKVSVEIYRSEGEDNWWLELVDEFGNSTVWDDPFETESEALVEAKKAILEEHISSFIGPEDGKGDGNKWQ